MSLASPWPPSPPVSLHQLHFCLSVCESSSCLPLLAWAEGSMSDQASYCNHWPIPQPPFGLWPPLPLLWAQSFIFAKAGPRGRNDSSSLGSQPLSQLTLQQLWLVLLLLLLCLHIVGVTERVSNKWTQQKYGRLHILKKSAFSTLEVTPLGMEWWCSQWCHLTTRRCWFDSSLCLHVLPLSVEVSPQVLWLPPMVQRHACECVWLFVSKWHPFRESTPPMSAGMGSRCLFW